MRTFSSVDCAISETSRSSVRRGESGGECRFSQAWLIGRRDQTFVGPHRIGNAAGLNHAHAQSSACLIVAADDDGRAGIHSKRARGFDVQSAGDCACGNWERELSGRQSDCVQNFIRPTIFFNVEGEKSRSQRIADVWRKSKFRVDEICDAEKTRGLRVNLGAVPAQPENFGDRVHRVGNKSGDFEDTPRSDRGLKPVGFGCGAIIYI